MLLSVEWLGHAQLSLLALPFSVSFAMSYEKANPVLFVVVEFEKLFFIVVGGNGGSNFCEILFHPVSKEYKVFR